MRVSPRALLPALLQLLPPFVAGTLFVALWALGVHRLTGANQDLFSVLVVMPVAVCAVRSNRLGPVQTAARLAVTSASAFAAVYAGALVAWFGLVMHESGVIDGLGGVLGVVVTVVAVTAPLRASATAST